MRSRSARAETRGRTFPNWVIWALGGAFALTAVISGILIYNSARNVFSAWDGSGLPPLFQNPDADTTPGAPGAAAVEAQITPVAWNGTDRVTILAMGLDYRDWEAGADAAHSDSMMLVSIDPVSHTAGVLSIPRDLWVEVPEFGHNRINTAFYLGDQFNYPGDGSHPGGGPGLAMRTVESLIGVPIQFFAVIEFEAFERAIDVIGGVNILVTQDVLIFPIGREGVQLQEGEPYTLDGAETLAFARARRTEGGDFDRAQRQQQVLLAIRDTILNVDGLTTLLPRAPALYNEVASGVRTNLTLEQMVSLGVLALQISPENIHRGIIGPPDMVTLETLPDGAQVLRPVTDQIRELRDEIFTMTDAVGPSIDVADPAGAAGQEAASVEVLNGAGIEGLATRAADYLRGQGINVVNVANADQMGYGTTVILDYTGNPYTARYLMELLNLTQSQIFTQSVPDSPVDLAVIVGADYTGP